MIWFSLSTPLVSEAFLWCAEIKHRNPHQGVQLYEIRWFSLILVGSETAALIHKRTKWRQVYCVRKHACAAKVFIFGFRLLYTYKKERWVFFCPSWIFFALVAVFFFYLSIQSYQTTLWERLYWYSCLFCATVLYLLHQHPLVSRRLFNFFLLWLTKQFSSFFFRPGAIFRCSVGPHPWPLVSTSTTTSDSPPKFWRHRRPTPHCKPIDKVFWTCARRQSYQVSRPELPRYRWDEPRHAKAHQGKACELSLAKWASFEK